MSAFLPVQTRLEVLANLTHEALERALLDEQLPPLLVVLDLVEDFHARGLLLAVIHCNVQR